MEIIAEFVPLIIMLTLMPAIYGGYIKLSSHLLRYQQVTWMQGFIFGIAMIVLDLFIRVPSLFIWNSPPIMFETVLGLVITLAGGSWFFSTRAKDANGQAVGWRGGLLLTGLAVAFFIVTSIVLTLMFLFLVLLGGVH